RDTERAKRFELRAQRRQARRRRARRKEFARMRFERQHGRDEAQVFGALDQARQHRLMAAMDTVEVADRQRKRSVARLGQAAMDAHSRSCWTENTEFQR